MNPTEFDDKCRLRLLATHILTFPRPHQLKIIPNDHGSSSAHPAGGGRGYRYGRARRPLVVPSGLGNFDRGN
jgi:hypothetical protein